jgi:hypothetical protein
LFSLRQLRRIRKIHHQSERIKYPNSPQKPKRTLFASKNSQEQIQTNPNEKITSWSFFNSRPHIYFYLIVDEKHTKKVN